MRIHALIAAALVGAAASYAVPSLPKPIKVTQPDGTELVVQLRGDEYAHCYLTEDGYLLVNDNDAYYYGRFDAMGEIERTNILAKPADKRSASENAMLESIDMSLLEPAMNKISIASPLRKRDSGVPTVAQAPARASQGDSHPSYGIGLFSGTNFPSTGVQKSIVVLVRYTDVDFTLSDPYAYFNGLLNSEGFDQYSATGSARDYFVQNSSGVFLPDFDVYGPITLSHNRAYYGGNNSSGSDQHAAEMAIEACQQLDATVDFSQYDRDGDGWIDNIYVFYAGGGEASGGGASTVWPHSWSVQSYTSTPYYFDGVRLGHYACSNEWYSGKPDGIGTFVHEFGHVIGLPDIYATKYTGAFTPGDYSVMDQGSYNNNSRTPPCYGAFERNALGWCKPEIITEDTGYASLDNIGTTNEAYLIPTAKSSEFFLLENRQKTGWDAYIPGHGMLVWHVDYYQGIWSQNLVNNAPSHQYVDIEEADNIQSSSTRAGDPFPGTSNVTSFTDSTTPSMRTWDGTKLGLPLRSIEEHNGLITFAVGVVRPTKPGETILDEVDPETITCTSFKATWSTSNHATTYFIRVEAEDGSYNGVYKLRDVGNVIETTVTGLSPAVTYTVSIQPYNEEVEGDISNTVKVRTLDPTVDFFTTVANDATEVGPTSFVANWEAIAPATDYLISITQKVPYPVTIVEVPFDGGPRDVPEGWNSEPKFSYSAEGFYGKAAPSARFTGPASITSCTYSDNISEFSFWCRGVNACVDNTFRVSVYTNAWNVVDEFKVNNDAGEVHTYNVDPTNPNAREIATVQIPEGVRQIRIEYVEAEHKGNGAIDDIYLIWGGQSIVDMQLRDYKNFSTGNTTSLLVDDLQPNTTYSYWVTATDGTLMAKTSEIKLVTTTDSTQGVEVPVIDENTPAVYYNLQGIRMNGTNLPAGIYIKVQGGKTTKVIF